MPSFAGKSVLVIAEKPSLARDIAAALPGRKESKNGFIEINGGEIRIGWCFGHMLEVKKPDEISEKWAGREWRFDALPITPEVLPLAPIPSSKAQLLTLRDLCQKADVIVNAGDAGREGELLIREVLEFAKATKKPLMRLWLHETTKSAVEAAWANLRDGREFDNLYAAARGRQMGDFWYGMTMTRAVTIAEGGSRTYPIGRVITPTMSFVVKRDLEIEDFKSRDFYEVAATFKHSALKFETRWMPSDLVSLDEEDRLLDKSVADGIVRKITGKSAKVIKSESRNEKERAPLPFHLGGLQAAASAKFGFSAKKTLEVAQALYEKHKVLSYPRTECRYLAESLLPLAPSVLKAIAKTAPQYAALCAKANTSQRHEAFNDKKVEEHHGLAPTVQVGSYAALSKDEQRLYDLVVKSYLALFLPVHEYKAMVLEVLCEGETFRATGRAPITQGWKEAYAGEDKGDDEKAPTLPDVPSGAALQCEKGTVLSKQTKPPARLTDGTLLTMMESVHKYVKDESIKKVLKEEQGLGTAATRADALERLVSAEYLQREGKFLVSTDKARKLWQSLPADMTEPGLTALFEQELKKVSKGESTLEKFLALQKSFIARQMAACKTRADKVEAAKVPCPKCATGKLVRRQRKDGAGYFWGCSGFFNATAPCKTAFNDYEGAPDFEGKAPRTYASSSASAKSAKKPVARKTASKPASKTAKK